MKNKLLILTSICAALSTPIAQATNGVYLQLDGGIAYQNGLPSLSEAGATSIDTSGTPNALRGVIGYNHDLTPLFGIAFEAGPGIYGQSIYNYANGDTSKIKSSTIEFLGVGTFHIQKMDLFIKAGAVRLSPETSGFNTEEGDTRNKAEGAIGLAYNFSPHFAASFTYAHVFGDSIDKINDVGYLVPSLNEGLFGIRYTFAS